MKKAWIAAAGVAVSLAVADGPVAGAAETLKCGGTPIRENPNGFNSPATYDIRAKGVTCKYAKKFIKKYLATYNPPKAPWGWRCTQEAGRKDRTEENCKKDSDRITFERDGIG